MPTERIWVLLARKLANEVTADESAEFEKLLRENEHLHYQVSIIIDLWDTNKITDQKNEAIIVDKLFEKIKKRETSFNSNRPHKIF